MHNFDRGIIKWLPFDGLVGYKNAILKLKERRSQVSKPILSPDQLEALNETLEVAMAKNKTATIYFYKKGLIYNIVGTVKKVEFTFKKIKIENYWLNADEILEIVL